MVGSGVAEQLSIPSSPRLSLLALRDFVVGIGGRQVIGGFLSQPYFGWKLVISSMCAHLWESSAVHLVCVAKVADELIEEVPKLSFLELDIFEVIFEVNFVRLVSP